MTEDDDLLAASFQRTLDHLSAAFAVTRGADHILIHANAAFHRLIGVTGEISVGRPIVDAFTGRVTAQLLEVLDRAYRAAVPVRNHRIDPLDRESPSWSCSVWPALAQDGEAEHLLMELHRTGAAEMTLVLQREVAEQMLLSALRERDAAESAEASSRRAIYLAAEGRRLAESLDEHTTLDALTRLALPRSGAWCIVDIIDGDGTTRRLAIIHPDPNKQALLRELAGRWSPEPGDPFGAPAALRSSGPTVIADTIDTTLVAAAHDAETLRVLQEVGAGSFLTVPLSIRDQLVGAITFVSGKHDLGYTEEDVKLAEALTIRSAMALDSARLHGEALTLREVAEAANRAKGDFLGTMSHELRTPLNAIGGYVELIDMGLRGPVTDAQHVDLGRIRSNQQHLMGLITDILNLVRIGSGRVLYNLVDVPAHEVLTGAVAMVEPLMLQKTIIYKVIECDPTLVARADRDKVIQILVNLLANSVKFTPAGGELHVDCDATEDTVRLRVTDTGIGIPADKLEAIFEPFVQVRQGLAGRDEGVGLGLAISRDLARAMNGNLIVESTVGEGSRFTLVLPRALAASADP